MANSRDRLHELVDQLPQCEVHTAERFLEFLRDSDPLLRALYHAPIDDELLTDEDLEAIEEARADYAAGRTISWEEARRILLSEA